MVQENNTRTSILNVQAIRKREAKFALGFKDSSKCILAVNGPALEAAFKVEVEKMMPDVFHSENHITGIINPRDQNARSVWFSYDHKDFIEIQVHDGKGRERCDPIYIHGWATL